MMPSASPLCTSKLTSLSAQKSSLRVSDVNLESHEAFAPSDSRRMRYLFETFFSRRSIMLNNVGHRGFDLFEVKVRNRQDDKRDHGGNAERMKIRLDTLQHCAPELFDHAHHRIQRVKSTPALRHRTQRINNRTRKHPHLQQQRHRHAYVAKPHLNH